MMFHIIPDAVAITRVRGVFRQVQVFKFNGRVFVKHGSGYAWVMKSGDTSVPNLHLEEIHLPFKETYSPLGYMIVPNEYKGK